VGLGLVASKGPNRVAVFFPSPEDGKRCSFGDIAFSNNLEYLTMDKVQQATDSECSECMYYCITALRGNTYWGGGGNVCIHASFTPAPFGGECPFSYPRGFTRWEWALSTYWIGRRTVSRAGLDDPLRKSNPNTSVRPIPEAVASLTTLSRLPVRGRNCLNPMSYMDN
jgi:hypothetical protein